MFLKSGLFFRSYIAIVLAEMWGLVIIGKDKLPYKEACGLDFPKPALADAEIVYREMPKSSPNMYPN